MSTTIESLELEINSNSTQAVSGIDALSSSLSKLKNAIKGGVGLTSVANQVRNLDTALQSVDGSSADKIDKLANSLSKLSALGKIKISASIGNQIKNISSATAGLKDANYAAIDSLASSIKNLNGIGKASGLQSAITQLKKLPELAATLKDMDLDGLCSDLSKLSNALAPLASQANSVSNAFSKLPSPVNKLSQATQSASNSNNIAANSYVNFWAKSRMAYNAVRTGAQTIGSWITKSNEYIEDLNLFTASMGEYAGEAQKYAEQVSELMGIDPGQFMRYEGVFNTIIKGFGVASDRAYTMSKNLTQLGYDLSSFYNISFEDSMTKLQSGISGELEPLRRLGYDLSVARLQQEALNLGIEKHVSDMTQAEKSQLRYYAIMTQVTTAQGDMARTLNAPANQVRILQAQVTQCARALGNIFIPALNAVLPYAIALAKALRLVADQIAKFFGFTLPKVDYSGLGASISTAGNSVGNLADNADKAGKGIGKAAKKAKELKNNLLGIDELHIISPNDNSDSGSGSGGSGGDLGFDLPEYDFLGKLVDSKANEILKRIQDAFTEITAVVSGFLLAIGTILVISGANIPLGVALMAAGAAGLVSVIALNWNDMSDRLAKVLTMVTGILGGFLLAIGAFLVFTGANVPLGAALMVAGAVSLATAVFIGWNKLPHDLQTVLTTITAIVSGALIGLGAVLAFTGANVPLGVALMAAGAIGIVTAVALNWNEMPNQLKKALSTIAGIMGGAFLSIGAFLTFTGVAPEIGIPLLAAGAASIVSAIALNWGGMTGDLKSAVTTITTIVSGALLGLGFLLLWFGVSTPLAIGLLAAGAAGMVSAVALNKGALTKELKKTIGEILAIVGAGALAIGAILAFSGAATAIGIGLMVAGAASIATAVALNWDTLVSKIKNVITKILLIAGAASLAIGIILCLTGVGIPLGIGLILAGAGSLGTAAAINWDTISEKVSKGLGTVADKFGEFKDAVKKKLDKAGDAISEWAGGVKEFFTKGKDGKNAIDNIKEAGGEWGERLKEGFSDKFKKANKSWVKKNVANPVSDAIKDNPLSDLVVKVKNNSKDWWSNVKSWWSETTKNGVSMDAFVKLAKKGWSTVKGWIGNIPILDQGIKLAKHAWSTVKDWIGNIPTLDQAIQLVKNGWSTVRNWVGNIPTLDQMIRLVKSGWQTVTSWIGNIPIISQAISLIKSGWSTVRGWIGNIPTLSQAISLIKSGWSTVRNWIGNLPVISQAISLLKHGWSTVRGWIGNIPVINQAIALIKSGWRSISSFVGTSVSVGISLWRNGWRSISSFVGTSVSVGISLFKSGWTSFKRFFGLSSGGYNSGHGFKLFENGGYMKDGFSHFWNSIPKYANGTSNVGAHGSMFVAGENGTEMVGHINGQTEVLNRSQIQLAMRSAVISGMSQFVDYWRTLNTTMITCANAVINSVLVSSDVMQAAYATAGGSYDPSGSLADSIYADSQKANADAYSDANFSKAMKDFYSEYVEPTLQEIANDTKRQADKNEQTVVNVGNRTITDAVETQQRANGYKFIK